MDPTMTQSHHPCTQTIYKYPLWRTRGWCTRSCRYTYVQQCRAIGHPGQALLQPILLRRTKETRDVAGKPILTLPSSNVSIQWIELDASERDFYDVQMHACEKARVDCPQALQTRTKLRFHEFQVAGLVSSVPRVCVVRNNVHRCCTSTQTSSSCFCVCAKPAIIPSSLCRLRVLCCV